MKYGVRNSPGALISAVSHSLVSGGALGENSSTTRVSSEYFCDPTLDSSAATFLASPLIVLQCFTEITQDQHFVSAFMELVKKEINLFIHATMNNFVLDLPNFSNVQALDIILEAVADLGVKKEAPSNLG